MVILFISGGMFLDVIFGAIELIAEGVAFRVTSPIDHLLVIPVGTLFVIIQDLLFIFL